MDGSGQKKRKKKGKLVNVEGKTDDEDGHDNFCIQKWASKDKNTLSDQALTRSFLASRSTLSSCWCY
uniref:Ovule protein n=1 Tax=Syphacia muris TaxID=451379 RepID=A0A0N5ADC2_9BILA